MTLAAHQRYQYKPYTGSSHSWALDKCRNIDPGTRVLDIGPGSGAIGSVLKDRGVTELYAVEVDAGARAHVASIYRQVEASVEPFAGEQFDLILLLDVLEHMAYPLPFLKLMSELLAPGGTILISVPNVAHLAVRLPLLFGFFEYTERGILDRTHLQFFTRRRFRQFLKSCPELRTVEQSASIPPLELTLPRLVWDNRLFRLLARLHVAVARLLPGPLAYQHLAELRKE